MASVATFKLTSPVVSDVKFIILHLIFHINTYSQWFTAAFPSLAASKIQNWLLNLFLDLIKQSVKTTCVSASYTRYITAILIMEITQRNHGMCAGSRPIQVQGHFALAPFRYGATSHYLSILLSHLQPPGNVWKHIFLILSFLHKHQHVQWSVDLLDCFYDFAFSLLLHFAWLYRRYISSGVSVVRWGVVPL